MARLRGGVGGTLVLDADGLMKFAAGEPAVLARVEETYQRGGDVVMAASTLTEVLRGGAGDARVHRVLRRIIVASIGKDLARAAGELLGRTGMTGHRCALDALVAIVALSQQRPVVLLTSDPKDMARLTEEPHRHKSERIAVVHV
jgi:hypothetical protein